jgi:hypothetical protein
MVKVAAEAKLVGAFLSDPQRLLFFLIEIGDRFRFLMCATKTAFDRLATKF